MDADKNLIRVSKTLLDSSELQAIRRLDGDLRRYLYNMCLPFEPGIHLLPIGLIETVDARLHDFEGKRDALVEVFLAAYPRLCEKAAGRLRTLYNPLDYPPVAEVRSEFTCSWQYVSYGVPHQLREVSERMFQDERDKAAQRKTVLVLREADNITTAGRRIGQHCGVTGGLSGLPCLPQAGCAGRHFP